MLARAGMVFVGRVEGEVPLPLEPGRGPSSSLAEHGRFDYDAVDVDDVDMPAKINAGWWRMATEFELFDERREFLIGVDYRGPDSVEPESAWAKVRLLDEWDFAGSGVDLLRSWMAGLFTERFVPEFVVVSLDSLVMLETTVWGNGTVSNIAIRPDRVVN